MFKKIIIAGLSSIAIFSLSACNMNTSDDDKEDSVTETDTEKATPEEDEISLPDNNLQKKDQNKDVEALQTALIKLGYSIDITGVYDEKTVWAVTDLQFQTKETNISGRYDEDTKLAIENSLDGDNSIEPGKELPYKKESKTDDGKTVTGNPYDVLVLVNKDNSLPDDFLPGDLVTPDVPFPFTEDLPKKQMRQVAADALEELFAAADKEDLELFSQSGFRSFERQESIFNANVEKNGEKAANKYSARPGESEHQTGLTMDVTNAEVGFDLIIEFGDTVEGKWLKKHVADHGFIIRYPEGKEEITKYQYEPWHLRYVGEKAAKEIMDGDMTFEDYSKNL